MPKDEWRRAADQAIKHRVESSPRGFASSASNGLHVATPLLRRFDDAIAKAHYKQQKHLLGSLRLNAKHGTTNLELVERQLTALPPEIGLLLHLTELILYGNKLTRLPREIGLLTRLTHLDLGSNQLESLPDEIGLLAELIELDVPNNQLTNLTPEIGSLSKLTHLDLHGNRISSLPREIGLLTELTDLRLYGNRLATLPSTIGSLTNLTRLDLLGNQLVTLPRKIGALRALSHLYLAGTSITDEDLQRLRSLKRLKKLDITRTKVSAAGVAALMRSHPQCDIKCDSRIYQQADRMSRSDIRRSKPR